MFKNLGITKFEAQSANRERPATYHVHHHLDGNVRILVDIVLALGRENRLLVTLIVAITHHKTQRFQQWQRVTIKFPRVQSYKHLEIKMAICLS